MQKYPITDTALRWLELIFAERFGNSWILARGEEGLRLQLADAKGAIVFDKVEVGFTHAHSDQPFTWWDASSEGWHSRLENLLPAPGVTKLTAPLIETRNGEMIIHYDIPGLTYWMLARVEEINRFDLDHHNRFPAASSHAYKHGYLDHPVVDEWLYVLGQVIQRKWPSLELKRHEPRTVVSCDLDSPFASDGSWKQVIRRVGGDIIKRRSPRAAMRSIVGKWYAKRGDDHLDAYRSGTELIMEINERVGRAVAFYFIPKRTDLILDGRPQLHDARIRKLMFEIHARGHEIGIHPGYHTYRHNENMANSMLKMREALDDSGIAQTLMGGRQHFLRWETPTTARLLNYYELSYDSSLSYADHPGFRCGTCFEYPMFDAAAQRILQLRQRPLIVMECSVIADRYLGLGNSDAALELMQRYQQSCNRIGGQFSLLWHNSNLVDNDERRFYEALLAKC